MIEIAMNGLSKPGWLRKKNPSTWLTLGDRNTESTRPRRRSDHLVRGSFRNTSENWDGARCSRRFSRRWFLWENMGTWWFNHINVGRSWFHHQTLGIDSWVFLIYIIALQYSNLVEYHNSPTAWHIFFGGECPLPELLLMSQCGSPWITQILSAKLCTHCMQRYHGQIVGEVTSFVG
jgi:hypothetical protein